MKKITPKPHDSTKITITIDEVPPSVNGAYKKGPSGIYMTRNAHSFKTATAYIAWQKVKQQQWKIIPKGKFFKMEIEFFFKNKRFPDPNNLLKILIDALEGILFENDKWLYTVMKCPKIVGENKTRVTVFKPDE